MLNYREWCNELLQEIQNLSSQNVALNEVTKNNGYIQMGIAIKDGSVSNEVSASPVLYLEEYYEKYQHGWTLNEIAQEVYDRYMQLEQDIPSEFENVTKIQQWDNVSVKVYCQLVSAIKNQDLLKGVPHEIMDDLALVTRVLVSQNDNGIGSVLVDNKMLELYGISKEMLLEQAKINTPELFSVSVMSMYDKLAELMGEEVIPEAEKEFPMYVVTNDVGINGATAILYPGMEEQLKELVGQDYVLIPSSIHEMLVVPKSGNLKELRDMVHEVNGTLLGNEVLSDSIYELHDGKLVNLDKEIELENIRGSVEQALSNAEQQDMVENIVME